MHLLPDQGPSRSTGTASLTVYHKPAEKASTFPIHLQLPDFDETLEARAKGIDIAPKFIPAQVFDKRAVEKNQVVFHDVAAIEVKPHVKGNSVAVELTDFSVFYSQDSVADAEATLKDKGSKIVVERGQIVKVSKDAHGIVNRETLTQKWTDWIDYWSVDFDFESKREIIRVPCDKTKQIQMPGMERAEQLDQSSPEILRLLSFGKSASV